MILTKETELELPVLPVRDTVVFPRMLVPLFVGRDKSLLALEAAIQAGSDLVILTQQSNEVEDPTEKDLYQIGTEANVGRLLRMPDGTANILTEGKQRVQVVQFTQGEPYLRAIVRRLPNQDFAEETDEEPQATEAMRRAVLGLFEECVQLNQNIPEDAYIAAMNIDDPGWLADMISSVMEFSVGQRQQVLDMVWPTSRLHTLSIVLGNELDVLKLESAIHDKVQKELDKDQREYVLREKMRVIQTELGEIDVQTAEVNELKEQLEKIDLPDEVKQKVSKELKRLSMMPPAAPDVGIIRTYIEWLLEMPWFAQSEDDTHLNHVASVLDNNHFGIPKVKERILEYIAVRQRVGDRMRSPIICFAGPPGTGKTSLGRSIAEALGRKFIRVSLGGVRDEAEIRGHRRTYVGAMPGRIIQNIRRVGTKNPVFMLDEIDKISSDYRGDPSAALLEALDLEQNNAFSDHYLELPFDLSQVLFITTANLLHPIPHPLRDRMEVIEFSSYIDQEKKGIARQFLIPRHIKEHGLEDVPLEFSEGALQGLIDDYTNEAGVREFDRKIGQVCRKLTRKLVEDTPIPRQITRQTLPKYLGPASHIKPLADLQAEVGVAVGMAYTQTGGDIMPIEVSLMPGKGELTLTGQLGDVMKESVQAAKSFTRAHAATFNIPADKFSQTDIHLHVPEGAIPKDGPSAGITMATALLSAFAGYPVRADVAMTGEITLRGRVLPIGGVKEKLLAAHRAGIKTVIIPAHNKKDLSELPKSIQRALKIVLVSRMSEVLETALITPAEESV